jgi:histidinol dehydrogenase
MIRRLSTRDADFLATLDELLHFDHSTDDAIEATVAEILKRVRSEGDAAVLDYTRRFDKLDVATMAELELPGNELRRALDGLPAAQRSALEAAAQRVSDYHQRQKLESWSFTEADGTRLGQKITPLDRVGLYVPGGKAAYPSSVLMNALPAKVAGVGELIMVVPTPRGEKNALVLAAACLVGVDRVFTLGGAQAVAALAYGTQTIPQVDKIVGPGNAYVAAAKREVFGQVGIDSIAGPSEILVIADGENDPEWIAADLLSQAEHDASSQSILITDDAGFADKVAAAAERQIAILPRKDIASKSWNDYGAIITVVTLDDAVPLSDAFAPEHLEIATADPESFSQKVRHAGAIFLGRHTPEAMGDYIAGPNHVLPTSRTARFSSGLSVLDYMKRTTLLRLDAKSMAAIGPDALTLAESEGLEAHARSISARLNRKE